MIFIPDELHILDSFRHLRASHISAFIHRDLSAAIGADRKNSAEITGGIDSCYGASLESSSRVLYATTIGKENPNKPKGEDNQ